MGLRRGTRKNYFEMQNGRSGATANSDNDVEKTGENPVGQRAAQQVEAEEEATVSLGNGGSLPVDSTVSYVTRKAGRSLFLPAALSVLDSVEDKFTSVTAIGSRVLRDACFLCMQRLLQETSDDGAIVRVIEQQSDLFDHSACKSLAYVLVLCCVVLCCVVFNTMCCVVLYCLFVVCLLFVCCLVDKLSTTIIDNHVCIAAADFMLCNASTQSHDVNKEHLSSKAR